MSAPVVTLATEPPATPPEAERESVLWRADSLTHTFSALATGQVIYDTYIALGERRTAASHSIRARSHIHVVAYFQTPGSSETSRGGEFREARALPSPGVPLARESCVAPGLHAPSLRRLEFSSRAIE